MMAVYGVAREWHQYPEAYGNFARSAHPVVALFGGADQGVPPEEVAAVAAALDQAPAPHDVHVHPGAPHSFFGEHFSEHVDACRDVWERLQPERYDLSHHWWAKPFPFQLLSGESYP